MIISENLKKSNFESVLAGVDTYSVITGQTADSLHDLVRVAELNGYRDLAKQISEAESLVREGSAKLSALAEENQQEEE